MEVTLISPGPEGDLEEAGVLTGCGCQEGQRRLLPSLALSLCRSRDFPARGLRIH